MMFKEMWMQVTKVEKPKKKILSERRQKLIYIMFLKTKENI